MNRQRFTNQNHASNIHASREHQHAADRWVDPDWGKDPAENAEGGIWLFVMFIILVGCIAMLAIVGIDGIFA